MYISNYGTFGHDPTTDDVGCWWPKGSGQNYIFGAGIWFGTVDSTTGDTLVTIGYGPAGGETEVVPGLLGQDPYAPNVIIYMYPDPWPAPQDTFPMAPQDTISNQDSWCCYNDGDSTYHIPGDTRPIDIEVYQTIYAWDMSGLADVVFFIHDIVNVSGHTLYDCYVGVCTDCDIGNEGGMYPNDRAAGVLGRWYVINSESLWINNLGYQWQEVEEPLWTTFPGTIGFDLLQTPFDLVPGEDKDGDGIPDQYERDSAYYVNNLPDSLWDADNDGLPDWRDASQNPQLEMTALKNFGRITGEPGIDVARYLALAGYDFLTGIYEPYDTLPSDTDDQRFLMASGPFDLESDSMITIVYAVLFANWYDVYQTPDSGLARVDAIAQRCYNLNWNPYVSIAEYLSEHVSLNFSIYPNPVLHNTNVSFCLPVSGTVSLTLYDITGRLVKELVHEHRAAGTHSLNFSTRGLAQGTYFLMLETPDEKTSQALVVLH
jgi:hypothetical protein